MVWQCNSARGPLCLRGWSTTHPSHERLTLIHEAIHRVSHLHFVPRLLRTSDGFTTVFANGRLWELSTWLPGEANYLKLPSHAKLLNAMEALSQLHSVWALDSTTNPSPTVAERSSRIENWLARVRRTGSESIDRSAPNEFRPLTTTTLYYLETAGPEILRELNMAGQTNVDTHFVLRDIWSDHVLYSGDAVSGIIDFGAGRVDEPATDLARLLGSLHPFEPAQRSVGIEHYNHCRRALLPTKSLTSDRSSDRLSTVDTERVRILDRTATLLGALQWLDWLVLQRKEFPVPTHQLASRWSELVKRLQADHQASPF